MGEIDRIDDRTPPIVKRVKGVGARRKMTCWLYSGKFCAGQKIGP
jgi:hypothetical protein